MNPHGLLPWYANRTLDSDEKAQFESHLAGCERCRSDLEALKKMQAEIESYGEALLDDHPSAEELVAVVRGADEVDADRARRVRGHLALCATCGDEARWAAGEAVATGIDVAPSGGRKLPAWAWSVAAGLALVAVTASVTTTLVSPRREAGIVKMFLVEPTQRAAGGESEVRVPRDLDVIHVLLEVDLAPGAFPAVLEVVDAAGNAVHRNASVAAADLYRGRFLFYECGRDVCPDGTYRARVIPATGRGPATEYPFRVIRGSGGAPP